MFCGDVLSFLIAPFICLAAAPAPSIERLKLSTLLSKHGIHGALFVMGEVLFITRPLIYVLLIRKYGIRSWIPWFLSLAVDFVGVGVLTQVAKSRHGGKERNLHFTSSENDEVRIVVMLSYKTFSLSYIFLIALKRSLIFSEVLSV